jgi:mannosyl-3-phosphoglycerate phosphatase
MTSSAWLIFTDLDGTLLNSDTYDYAAAVPVLAKLQAQQRPVIPVTSKTRAEVETLRIALNLQDPFIVENGSGLFVPHQHPRFKLAEAELMGDYQSLALGGSYVLARATLKALAQLIGRPLKGFGDLSVAQIEQLTGLSATEAHQAKSREFSEPFLTPKNITAEALQAAAAELGFQVVVGDRFSHLIGGEAGKGAAVAQMVSAFRAALPPDTPVQTLGLGNSPNDLPMLEAVDHAVVLPGKSGPHPQLADRGWAIAPSPAPEGWAIAVEEALAAALSD